MVQEEMAFGKDRILARRIVAFCWQRPARKPHWLSYRRRQPIFRFGTIVAQTNDTRALKLARTACGFCQWWCARTHARLIYRLGRKVTKKARLDERFVSTSFPPLTHIVPDSFRHPRFHCFDPLPTRFVPRSLFHRLPIFLQFQIPQAFE